MSTRRKAKAQRTLWEGVIDLDVRALWEPWMIEADRLLDDEGLVAVGFQAQRSDMRTAARWGARKHKRKPSQYWTNVASMASTLPLLSKLDSKT